MRTSPSPRLRALFCRSSSSTRRWIFGDVIDVPLDAACIVHTLDQSAHRRTLPSRPEALDLLCHQLLDYWVDPL